MNLKPGYLIIMGLAVIAAFAGGYVVGAVKTGTRFQAEAVKAGHAVYRVIDEYGTVRFEWLPHGEHEKNAPPPAEK